MIEPPSFTIFVLASLALLIVPGPAVLYIVARSIDQGRTAGVVSALGIALGSVALVLATALGVSALLAASSIAFDIVRYAGGAYLVYLGIRTWRAGVVRPDDVSFTALPMRRVFREGIVVNFLNPKTAIFFVAFLPQFVDPAGSVRLQMVMLGMTFVAMGVVTDSVYALLAGTLADRLRADARFPRVRRIAASIVYLGLGLAAALVHPTN